METKTVVAPEIEQVLVSPPRSIPKAEHLEPFVAAARDVLEQELGSEVESGKLALANGTCTTHEVTAIIGITGQLTGMAMYGMSEETALAIVGQLMGSPCDELDDLALSPMLTSCSEIFAVSTVSIGHQWKCRPGSESCCLGLPKRSSTATSSGCMV